MPVALTESYAPCRPALVRSWPRTHIQGQTLAGRQASLSPDDLFQDVARFAGLGHRHLKPHLSTPGRHTDSRQTRSQQLLRQHKPTVTAVQSVHCSAHQCTQPKLQTTWERCFSQASASVSTQVFQAEQWGARLPCSALGRPAPDHDLLFAGHFCGLADSGHEWLPPGLWPPLSEPLLCTCGPALQPQHALHVCQHLARGSGCAASSRAALTPYHSRPRLR